MATGAVAAMPPRAPLGREHRRRNFLSDVVIDFGPPQVLGRLFLKADSELRAQGVSVSFVGFDELMDVNRRNPASWRPILPLFDPGIGGISPANGFAVLGFNTSGEPVYAHACRHYSLRTTLKDEIESLRILYADPERSKGPGEAIRVTAPSAAATRGSAVFIGAVWYRPDYRKKGMMQATSPLVRALSYTRWQSNFAFSFMADDLVRAGTAGKARFQHVEYDLLLDKTPVYRDGILKSALVWTNAREQMQHFEDYLGPGADAEVDAVVQNRTA